MLPPTIAVVHGVACLLEVRHQVHAEPALEAKPYVWHLASIVTIPLPRPLHFPILLDMPIFGSIQLLILQNIFAMITIFAFSKQANVQR